MVDINIDINSPLKYEMVDKPFTDDPWDHFIRNFCNMKCDLCEYRFFNFGDADQHYSTIHQMKPHISCCGKKYGRREALVEHMDWHINPEKFVCQLCEKKLPSLKSLRCHINKKHENPDPPGTVYECPTCKKIFAKKNLLNSHVKYHGEKKYGCTQCETRFVKQSHLNQHVQKVHTKMDMRQFKCNECDKTFSYNGALKSHKRRLHSPIVKVKCNECNKWLNKLNLYPHMRRHREEGLDHTCDICGRPSPNSIALNEHKRSVHAEVHPHKCHLCDKSYYRPRYLREHIAAVHENAYIFNCEFCSSKFRRKTSYYTHRMKKHPEEYSEIRRNIENSLKDEPI